MKEKISVRLNNTSLSHAFWNYAFDYTAIYAAASKCKPGSFTFIFIVNVNHAVFPNKPQKNDMFETIDVKLVSF